MTLTLQIPSAPLWGKQEHFFIYNTQNISCILFFVCPPAIVFLKNGKKILAVQTNQITKGILRNYSAFALNERSKQKIYSCPSAFSQLPSCKTGCVWKEERDAGRRNRKQTFAGGGFVCPPVRLSVKYVQVNPSSVCVSISKPVYLTNSHLIFLYLYSDRKRICAFCTVC